MRVKTFLIYCILGLAYLSFSIPTVYAYACKANHCDPCSGCGGTQQCTYGGQFETVQCDTCRILDCYNQNLKDVTGSETNDGYTSWSPGGYPDTSCTSYCGENCDTDQSCIYKTFNQACSLPDCPVGDIPTPAPTNNPTNSSLIAGNVQYDVDAAAAGTYCSQSDHILLSPAGAKVTVTNTAASSTTYGTTYTSDGWFVNTKNSGSTYTVTLDLSNQSGDTSYVCSCPAPIDPENPYLCRYTGVTSPSSSVNFYLKEYDLSNNSWFQVFGGNLFARYGVADVIPYAFCSLYSNCQAALSVPLTTSTNQLSSGFASH